MKMRKKILVIDDEPLVVEVLKIRLKMNNYEVITAGDGTEGIERAVTEKPDLIILDVVMPGLDGYQVCQKLKEDTNTKTIPVIMLTALGQSPGRKKGYSAGAQDYIFKPFDDQELLNSVERALKYKMVNSSKKTRNAN
jgi:DNA-binding response OmpR family regulator